MSGLADEVDVDMLLTNEHRRYDSEEFDYSGCVTCDANGDTLGWPCPTVKAERDASAKAPHSDTAHSRVAPDCDAGYAHSDPVWPEAAL
jgi:hypothetical protein